MTNPELSVADREMYRRVEEVLHYIWDPIGVSGIPEARDEYHAYVPKVFSLVTENAEARAIAAYLDAVTTEHLGLTGDAARALRAAAALLAWKGKILRDHY